MANNGGSDDQGEGRKLFEHNSSSDTLDESRERERTEVQGHGGFWPPPVQTALPTVMASLVQPAPPIVMPIINMPGNMPDPATLRPNTLTGANGLVMDMPLIQSAPASPRLEVQAGSAQYPKLGGSLFLGHVASYPAVSRLSRFIQERLPLGPLVFETTKGVTKYTGKMMLAPLRSPLRHGDGEKGEAQDPDTILRRILLTLDARAASTLRNVDHLVIMFLDSTQSIRKWIISSMSQLRDLVAYFKKTYGTEATKWAGAGDVVVFIGAVSFTIAVSAFDAVTFVGEWFFNAREGNDVETQRLEGEREQQETSQA